MKRFTPFALLTASLMLLASPHVYAVDFAYFKAQSCDELSKESDVLKKAEKDINDSKKKKESNSNTQAVITTLLIGWPFWGNEDHGDANNMLAEIRVDLNLIKKAQKANKCT